MARTIHVNFALEDVADIPASVFDAAMGYLATWAMNTSSKYDVVNLYLSDGSDVTAIYTSSSNQHTGTRYVIVGIYHDDEKRYSFHS